MIDIESVESSNSEAEAAHIQNLAESGEAAIGVKIPENEADLYNFILAVITEHDSLRAQQRENDLEASQH